MALSFGSPSVTLTCNFCGIVHRQEVPFGISMEAAASLPDGWAEVTVITKEWTQDGMKKIEHHRTLHACNDCVGTHLSPQEG